MAQGFAHYTCCLIVLTVCVDRGDGRWKKKDRENLQEDIELFRKMTDKIEHEIEDFYDEYSSKRLKEQILEGLLQKYKSNIVGGESSKNVTWQYEVNSHESGDYPTKINNLVRKSDIKQSKEIVETNELSHLGNFQSAKVNKTKGPRWPKFEDILLEIGKRYDWKNDRWIKVKVKLKETEKDKISDSNVDIHEIHKFRYKIVKLSKSKNRRNVVVVVSAVR